MKKPLTICILDRTDTKDFEQLEDLLKKFMIDVFIRNKPEYMNCARAEKK